MSESIYLIVLLVLAGIVGVLGFIIGGLVYRIKNKEFFPDRHPKLDLCIRKSSEYDAMIAKTLFKIRQKAEASKVALSRFHNGGYFCNGFEMKRFTVTHETPYGSSAPLQDKNLGTLISRYPVAMTTLATFGTFFVHDVDDCPDPNFKRDMKEYGFKSTYLFLIKQFDGSEEGFLGINWKDTHVMEEDTKAEVKNELPRLLGLMNMLEESLKE